MARTFRRTNIGNTIPGLYMVNPDTITLDETGKIKEHWRGRLINIYHPKSNDPVVHSEKTNFRFFTDNHPTCGVPKSFRRMIHHIERQAVKQDLIRSIRLGEIDEFIDLRLRLPYFD